MKSQDEIIDVLCNEVGAAVYASEYDASLIYEEESKVVEDLIRMIKDVRAYKVENNLAPNAKVNLTLISETIDQDLFTTYLSRFYQ